MKVAMLPTPAPIGVFQGNVASKAWCHKEGSSTLLAWESMDVFQGNAKLEGNPGGQSQDIKHIANVGCTCVFDENVPGSKQARITHSSKLPTLDTWAFLLATPNKQCNNPKQLKAT
ncbi:uncharacterized protein DS421_18g622620 [Arachis hypogaea]|nr:uncharacterized protein DS421_18g622620 [Arachis hypogaea]